MTETCPKCKKRIKIRNNKNNKIDTAIQLVCYKNMQLQLHEWEYLQKQISDSPTIAKIASQFYLSTGFESKNQFYTTQGQKLYKYSLSSSLDNLDLNALKESNNDEISQEYCQKAVEQRQWDHIYYLTKNISAVDAIACLDPNDENHKYCNCPEAVKLVIGHWPEEVLENPNFLNPSADPYDGVALRKELREAIKKYAK